MRLALLALPAALVAALAAAPAAQASPMVPTGVHAGGVRIGVGVGFPVGGSTTRTVETGYWTTQQVPVTRPVPVTRQVPYQVTVQVPDRVIGYDAFGRPLWAYRHEVQTQWRTETVIEHQTVYVAQRVWVSTGQQVVRHAPAYGTVGIGFRIR